VKAADSRSFLIKIYNESYFCKITTIQRTDRKRRKKYLERRLYNFLVYYIHLCTVHVIRNVRLKSIFAVIKQAKFRKDFKF